MPEIVEIPVVWLQGGACTGCAVSLLNSFSPGAASLVLRELTPGKHMSLRFQANIMAGQGQQVLDVLHDETVRDRGGYVLVMEGSLQRGHELFATLGEKDGREIPIHEHAAELARSAMAVVCIGTCSSFGGIPAGAPNPTGAISMSDLLAQEDIAVPVVNVPGCPPHPDWFVGSLMAVSLYGLETVAGMLDELQRPTIYYGKVVHENVEVTGPTRAGAFNDEKPLGPLMLRGDHGPVAYRNIRIQPVELE